MKLWTDLIGWLRLVLTAEPSARNMGSGGGTDFAVGATGSKGAAGGMVARSGSGTLWTDSP